MAVAAITSAYSFRVLYAAFVTTPNARRVEITHSGVPLTMAFPLLILSVGSIVAGYCLSDALSGWGSSFWTNSVYNSPGTNFLIASHLIPVWASWLPLGAITIGLFLAYAYTWPMPWCVSQGWKAFYLFLMARAQFDNVFNQQVASPILKLGFYSWALLDKGVLEILGPTGLNRTVLNWVMPTVNKWQTGTVHDYALVFKLSVLVGLAVIAFPTLWFIDFGVDPRALAVGFLLIVTYGFSF
jgi:NADH-ubiquinone oxidoreductase chain 5